MQVSQEDMDELQREFQERLGAAERKVFALTKERDALKRAAAAAAAGSSGGGAGPGGKSSSELEAALKGKEELVTQVRVHVGNATWLKRV